jgi:type 1 glutamine amidotransferase
LISICWAESGDGEIVRKIILRGLLVLALLVSGAAAFGAYKYYMWFGGGGEVFETDAPQLPADMHPTAILVFTKTNGFRDDASVEAATEALQTIAAKRGWTAFVTDNGAVFNPVQLARFKAVVGNNISGNNLLPIQQAAFRDYMEKGGGFVGIHGAGGDPSYVWRWYVETLIGAQFKGHTMSPHFQQATIDIEDRNDPATRHLGPTWIRTDEWYSFERSPRDHVHVLASLDERSYSPKMWWKSVAMGVDHPIVWKHCVGKGRAFYTALGHTPSSYSEPAYVQMLTGAIAWAAGLEGDACTFSQPQSGPN